MKLSTIIPLALLTMFLFAIAFATYTSRNAYLAGLPRVTLGVPERGAAYEDLIIPTSALYPNPDAPGRYVVYAVYAEGGAFGTRYTARAVQVGVVSDMGSMVTVRSLTPLAGEIVVLGEGEIFEGCEVLVI